MKQKKLTILFIITLFLLPSFASAIDIPGWPLVPCGLERPTPEEIAGGKVLLDDSYYQPCGQCDLFQLLKNIIDFVSVGLMPPLAVLLFVWGGFLILLGGAAPSLYSKGKEIFKNTFFGVMILLSAWMITNTLIQSVGSEYDKADSWWQFTCTESAAPVPPTTILKYSCAQNGQCVLAENGQYTNSNCDNQCESGGLPPIEPIRYDCNEQNQCVVTSDGRFTSPVCNDFCQPPLAGNLLIITPSLPNGAIGQSYTQIIQTSGGAAPLAWTLTGSLPPGLIFDTFSGVIAGNPTTAGTYSFSVTVTDNSTPKQSTTKQFNITVGTSTSDAVCLQSGLNLCQGQQTACSNSSCNQYLSAVNQYASRTGIPNGANLLKAIMFNESSCDAREVSFDFSSFGLMQFQPATANIYRSRCGITQDIDEAWLTNPANAEASICLGAEFIRAISISQCGNSIRNIAAGYNGGPAGNKSSCAPSVDCASDQSCSNEPVKRWECLYEDAQHQICNGGNDPRVGYNETRNYATKVLYCYNNPGF